MIKINYPYAKIDTQSTTLLFKAEKWKNAFYAYHKDVEYHDVAIQYYGARISDYDNYDIYGINPLKCDRVGGALDDYMKARMPYSTEGMANNRESLILLDNADGTNTNRFKFVSFSAFKGGVEIENMPHARNGAETLVIELYDEPAKIRLYQYYTVFDDTDAIAVCQKVKNENDKSVFLKRLMSLQLDLPDDEYIVNSFDGHWCAERTRHQTNLKSGKYVIDSKLGASSPIHNPFIYIEGVRQNDNIYAFNLIYSGNHKEIVEVSPYGDTRVLTGMNDYLLNYEVIAGGEFITPQAVMANAKTVDKMTVEMHKFANNHVINPVFAHKARPVVFNHWEGTGIDFNEEKLLKMADVAMTTGVELFVMDDGWFGHRWDDRTSLGDWYVNKEKFPNGLKGLSDGIKARGMQFGIWVEPEMISIDSDLYRAHPEYAMEIPGRVPVERRSQLMIDMANPAVQDYLIKVLSDMIDECEPDYIKWDYNRAFSDVYSHAGIKTGEYHHKFILGTYRVMNALTTRYPHILFEGCSSGGGRFDLGVFYYFPQTWGSDNGATYTRMSIHCGTIVAYPQSTVGAHIVKEDYRRYMTETSSLEDRFNIQSVGAFGYECDITKYTGEELEIVKKQIAYYKAHREVLQFGTYYCLNNYFDDKNRYSYMTVSEDKSEAMLVISQVDLEYCHLPFRYKLAGLDPNAVYSLEMRPQANVSKENTFSFTAKGDMLMNYGLDFDELSFRIGDDHVCSGICSRMYYIKKIG